MARCNDCNKFVQITGGEANCDVSIDNDSGVLVEIEVSVCCEECGSDIKTATITAEIGEDAFVDIFDAHERHLHAQIDLRDEQDERRAEKRDAATEARSAAVGPREAATAARMAATEARAQAKAALEASQEHLRQGPRVGLMVSAEDMVALALAVQQHELLGRHAASTRNAADAAEDAAVRAENVAEVWEVAAERAEMAAAAAEAEDDVEVPDADMSLEADAEAELAVEDDDENAGKLSKLGKPLKAKLVKKLYARGTVDVRCTCGCGGSTEISFEESIGVKEMDDA